MGLLIGLGRKQDPVERLFFGSGLEISPVTRQAFVDPFDKTQNLDIIKLIEVAEPVLVQLFEIAACVGFHEPASERLIHT